MDTAQPVFTLAKAVEHYPAPSSWDGGAGGAWRQNLAETVQASLRTLWAESVESQLGIANDATPGLALACVGSLARREAGPASDLDLVLLTDGSLSEQSLNELVKKLWYPLWDAGAQLDHSVRTVSQCRSVATADLAAALGMLDLQHVAGDEELTRTCTAAILTDWRKATRKRLGELTASAQSREEAAGSLYNLIEPDLKEAHGGLRDVGLIRALVASSLSDYQHVEVDAALETLLNVRDALALATGRPSNRLGLSVQDRVAEILGYDGEQARDDMLVDLYDAARVIGAELDSTVRTASRAARPARRVPTLLVRGQRSAPRLTLLDRGVAQLEDEVVLADGVVPETEPLLPLRVALASARSGLPVAAVTRKSLSRCPQPQIPWNEQHTLVRRENAEENVSGLELFVELLHCGTPLVQAWEDLDLAGLPARWLPGWEQIRNRPQHHPIHVWTVDRHNVRATSLVPALLGRETLDGVEAVRLDALGLPRLESAHAQRVLLLATLLHDLGKVANTPDHSVTGAERAPALLSALGVEESERVEIVALIRHHLLLSEVAQKAPGDPESARRVHDALDGNLRLLAQLRLLTEADGRATGPRAWTSWCGGVIDQCTRSLAKSFTIQRPA